MNNLTHKPLDKVPPLGTLVYLVADTDRKDIQACYYVPAISGKALREGRIFATKEDALVCLYGPHYSTLKPEDEIGQGTIPPEG